MKDFVAVGRVKDAHGLKGELYITLFAGEAAWLKKLKEIRLVPPPAGQGLPAGQEVSEGQAGAEEAQERVAPREPRSFAVRSARLHKKGLIVLSPDIRGRTEAEKWRGWLLEIPNEFLVSKPGESIYLIEIKNFKVHVGGRGEVGEIIGFSSNGAQDLLVVATPEGEYEIPFVAAFVNKIDDQSRIVYMDLPVGLLGEEIEGEEPESGAEEADED